MVETMSREYVEKNGGSLREVQPDMEAWVWQQPNPYRMLYTKIKAEHKDFQKRDPNAVAGQKAAPSVSAMGGSTDSSNVGWTSTKIDNLPEDKLGGVPKDIYEQYMKGKLK